MGIYTSAWLAYGIRIPYIDLNQVETELRGGTVGYLTTGPYGRDSLYLTTAAQSADLGTTEPILRDTFDAAYEEWNEQLRSAAVRLRVLPETEPSWLLIADVS